MATSINVKELLIGTSVQLKCIPPPGCMEVSQVAFPGRQPFELNTAIVWQIVRSVVPQHDTSGILEGHGNETVVRLRGFLYEWGAVMRGPASAPISEEISQWNADGWVGDLIIVDLI